ESVRGFLAPLAGCGFSSSLKPGVRKNAYSWLIFRRRSAVQKPAPSATTLSVGPTLMEDIEDIVEQLRQRIQKQGPLSFRDYMEEVLRFYYSSPRNPIGTDGDFYTSADL